MGAIPKKVNRLAELAYKYGSDKSPALGYSYTDFYYQMFADKRNSINKLLVIGSGDKVKNNLYMWQDFLPKAKVYGIVNSKNLVLKKNNIQTFLGDRSNPIKLANIIKRIGTNIDIVIDEGSKETRNIISSCRTIMPFLKKEAIYIIENTDRQQANTAIASLNNYNCHVIRHSRMISSYDRLISITNKTA
ncbi:hypothetical protein A2803_05295 [Candidatus Woesebacteria bacterium RIFCSPHIGHO2_01_FULL_44_21]|uniref:Uncharacterized protein n=1 Tax=Candidatus Woesebacteria bacterium RIFCSPHIGHO2_01_FULL_44_21 TaxID=1802503 RepID=A0A1F7YYA8_9BACT|nr:MAG: hypothetical protein A2803_05295 [Candidatus Woesebacteria bacterium RIFCSPHIGHO2_01_FULL_44_21]OGM69067.1 MAG: hypothetical protein A2897_04520 [Candidatus Woesebacteria bacterium RIFCSPLOWO2_01_FULL_44_24b]